MQIGKENYSNKTVINTNTKLKCLTAFAVVVCVFLYMKVHLICFSIVCVSICVFPPMYIHIDTNVCVRSTDTIAICM